MLICIIIRVTTSRQTCVFKPGQSNQLTLAQVDSSQGAGTSQRWSRERAKDLVTAIIHFFILTVNESVCFLSLQRWQQIECIKTDECLITLVQDWNVYKCSGHPLLSGRKQQTPLMSRKLRPGCGINREAIVLCYFVKSFIITTTMQQILGRKWETAVSLVFFFASGGGFTCCVDTNTFVPPVLSTMKTFHLPLRICFYVLLPPPIHHLQSFPLSSLHQRSSGVMRVAWYWHWEELGCKLVRQTEN